MMEFQIYFPKQPAFFGHELKITKGYRIKSYYTLHYKIQKVTRNIYLDTLITVPSVRVHYLLVTISFLGSKQ